MLDSKCWEGSPALLALTNLWSTAVSKVTCQWKPGLFFSTWDHTPPSLAPSGVTPSSSFSRKEYSTAMLEFRDTIATIIIDTEHRALALYYRYTAFRLSNLSVSTQTDKYQCYSCRSLGSWNHCYCSNCRKVSTVFLQPFYCSKPKGGICPIWRLWSHWCTI